MPLLAAKLIITTYYCQVRDHFWLEDIAVNSLRRSFIFVRWVWLQFCHIGEIPIVPFRLLVYGFSIRMWHGLQDLIIKHFVKFTKLITYFVKSTIIEWFYLRGLKMASNYCSFSCSVLKCDEINWFFFYRFQNGR